MGQEKKLNSNFSSIIRNFIQFQRPCDQIFQDFNQIVDDIVAGKRGGARNMKYKHSPTDTVTNQCSMGKHKSSISLALTKSFVKNTSTFNQHDGRIDTDRDPGCQQQQERRSQQADDEKHEVFLLRAKQITGARIGASLKILSVACVLVS